LGSSEEKRFGEIFDGRTTKGTKKKKRMVYSSHKNRETEKGIKETDRIMARDKRGRKSSFFCRTERRQSPPTPKKRAENEVEKVFELERNVGPRSGIERLIHRGEL